jgi:hypothetical protein
MINQGLDWLEQRLMGFCSSPVEYRRDAQILTIDAVFGKTDYEAEDDNGISVGGFVWDFLIDAATLTMEPEVGDVIVTHGRQFEVMKLFGQGCWRWTGPNRKTYRIHTKDIGDDV